MRSVPGTSVSPNLQQKEWDGCHASGCSHVAPSLPFSKTCGARASNGRQAQRQRNNHPPLRVLQGLRQGLTHGSPNRASSLAASTEHDGLVFRVSLTAVLQLEPPRRQTRSSIAALRRPCHEQHPSKEHGRSPAPTQDGWPRQLPCPQPKDSSHKLFSHRTQTAPQRGRRQQFQQWAKQPSQPEQASPQDASPSVVCRTHHKCSAWWPRTGRKSANT